MPKELKSLTPTPEEVLARLKKEREVHWYALNVTPQHERKLVDLLKEKGKEAFVPLRQEKHRWSDRMKKIEVVLTPSIIFVRNSMDKANKTSVFVTRDVRAYIHAPGSKDPCPISDEAMADFMRLVDSNFEFKMTLPLVGDEVMVLDGPLKGLVGQLVRIDGNQQLVIRLNDAFGASVKLDAMSVNKVPKGTKSLPAEQVPNKV